jgi:putative tryptophan/tyrosine transport system substrate-binding protein
VIETRWGEGRLAEFPRIVSELIALPVDVLVTWGPQAVSAAQQATATVPIVMAIVHEPVAFGFVKSLARPGGNITGQAFQDSDLGTKRLELLKDIVPQMRRVALLWDPGGGGETGVRAVEAAAKKLGLTTRVLEVRRPEEFGSAFAAARKEGAHAMIQIGSPFLAAYRTRLIELTAAVYILVQALRGHAAGTTCATAQVRTLRERLLKVAVWVQRSVRRIVLHFPAAFPWRPTWRHLACALAARP